MNSKEISIDLAVYRKRLELSFDMFSGGIERKKSIDNGDLIPVKNWQKQCENGGFIDYDGHGNLVMEMQEGDWIVGKPNIYPSDITRLGLTIPAWATHVLWFNR